MSVALRICLILLSVSSLFYIIKKIRYSKMQIEYAIFWIVLSLIMIVMAVFPQIIYRITMFMGMISAANVVYLFIIGVLLLKVFMMTIEISNLENKVKELVQQIGISEKERRDEFQKLEGKNEELQK